MLPIAHTRTAVALLAVGALAFVAACSGGTDSSDDDDATTTTKPKIEVTAIAAVGPVAVERASAAGDLVPEDAAKIVAAVNAYVDAATIQPIVTGDPATGIEALFTPAAAAAAVTQPELVDNDLPEPTESATATVEPVALTALTNADGQVLLVSATLAVRLEVPTKDGIMVIDRRGDLVYEPVNGAWLIASYNLAVDRQIPDPPTTTAAPTTTKAKK